jgi:hypothetical protein
VLIFAIGVPNNVANMIMNTAKIAQNLVESVQKNAEK